ncbi:MAG: hypothetical protein IT304_09985 [Dehalococcoidia bacterium]|nr:hypothetical protein [Dehalococcoidia bacterium]
MAETPGGAVTSPTSLARTTDPKELIRKFGIVKKRRESMEREWKLNLAFYKGNQYAWYNRRSDRIEALPTEEGSKPRYRVRLVSNQILPGVQSYVSMLTKTKPAIYATPSSGTPDAIRGATVAERLNEGWWLQLGLEDKLKESLTWSCLGANGWWKIGWDPFAGKSMKFMVSPDGDIITDTRLADAFRKQLASMGVDPAQFEHVVYPGEIRVEAMPPFCVWIDPTAKSFEDAQWAVCEHSLTPEEIARRWPGGEPVKPDSIPGDYDSAIPFTSSPDKIDPIVKKVYIGYFMPGPDLPEGRYVVWIESPDRILYDGPWPFVDAKGNHIKMLPLVRFPGIRFPGRVEDEAIVTHARPIQKEINKTLSIVVEMQNLTARPQMIAPAGSLRQRPTNESGAVIEYNAVNGERPEWRDMPAVPPYVFEHLADMQARLDRLFCTTLITRGEVPPNVEAGLAIDLLQETAVDQIAPVIDSIEVALARAGKLMLLFAQKHYTEPRLMKIRGEGGRVSVQKFMGADIDGDVDFHAEAGSGLPRTRAMRMARIQELVNMQVLRPDQALKYLDLADMNGVRARLLADEDQAERENDRILNGEPVNPEAYQDALGALQAGVNPDTGQPLEPDPETGAVDEGLVMQLLERASLQPTITDNHPAHMDIHALTIKGAEFERWPPDARRRALMHYELHMQAANQPPMAEPQSPRVSLSIHGTLGPTGTSKLLQNSGVDVSPEDAMEPPLESVVIDTIDKPDMDSAGNDPLTQEDLAMQERTATALQTQQEGMRTQQEMLRTQQEVIRTHKAASEAELARKRAEQSDFRPKAPADNGR